MTDQRSRREFLKPTALDEDMASTLPVAGGTVRVATRAMACEFCLVMNPGAHERVASVGEVLELVHDVESWLSVYKPHSEITLVNQNAASRPVPVRREFFDLLQTAKRLYEATDGAFDIASGRQIQMWRECRAEKRVPTKEEVSQALSASGCRHVLLRGDDPAVSFATEGLLLDPGAIGKGFAIDEAAQWLQRSENGPNSFLFHGGHSSLIARGEHNHLQGWPVGIGNPLLTKKRLGTVLLHNQAMSTSGSNIQFFRQDGRRYGHILDPRTGWPVEGMLSVTVFADSAAVADALSTAFFVLGVENARKCCDNLPDVGAILIPFPERGKRVTPTIIGVPEEKVFWDEEQVSL